MASVGRPSKYTREQADAICEQIATSSKSMKRICEELNLPIRTVLGWLQDIEEFQQLYARAKEQQADFLAEEMLEIADDGSNDFMTITKGSESYNVEDKEWTSRSKLRVEARKWIASKLKPKKYGDKVELTGGLNNTNINAEVTPEEAKAIADALNKEL